jgi:hypothetical protein
VAASTCISIFSKHKAKRGFDESIERIALYKDPVESVLSLSASTGMVTIAVFTGFTLQELQYSSQFCQRSPLVRNSYNI